jgi:hypothetical protein
MQKKSKKSSKAKKVIKPIAKLGVSQEEFDKLKGEFDELQNRVEALEYNLALEQAGGHEVVDDPPKDGPVIPEGEPTDKPA